MNSPDTRNTRNTRDTSDNNASADAAPRLKTRFAPSPTGHLHVGSARTALFCHLLSRAAGGSFLLRIEDTDRARHVEGAEDTIIEDLNWLGIAWDEGFGKDGADGPYRQSERLEIYAAHIQRLLDAGKAYYAFDTEAELEAMRERAAAEKRNFSYPRPASFPSAAEAEKAAAEGRPVVVRFCCGDRPVAISDEIFGEVVVPADQQDDFIIRKADGWPTYHLANVVDDALMGVNFIVRGQEFLGQSWRHRLLREAFGWPEPRYAHLPLIMDMAGRKLSKRDGDVDIDSFRRSGYLPQAMVSFIALLGFSPANAETDRLSLERLRELFDVARIGKSNARFDREKLVAFNRDAAAEMLSTDFETLRGYFCDYLARNDAPIPTDDLELAGKVLAASAGFRTFPDVVDKCGVLFVDDEAYDYDPKAVGKVLDKGDPAGWDMLAAIRDELADAPWTAEQLDGRVSAFCEARGVGMGKVAQPIRVAVTGRTVSPALGVTLELLGREKALRRMDRCLARRP